MAIGACYLRACSAHISACCLHIRAIFCPRILRQTVCGDGMAVGSKDTDQRRGIRTKAVLPVRIKGHDTVGKVFDELVHTLDVTPDGVRLGSVHHQLKVLEEVTVFYRQRRIRFRVAWTKKLNGTSEFQVGLQAVTQENDAWGMNFSEYRRQAVPESVIRTAAAV
jgi:hypothetical protein